MSQFKGKKLLEKVVEFLKERKEKKFSPAEIAAELFVIHADEVSAQLKSEGSQAFVKKIRPNIYAQREAIKKKCPNIISVGSQPIRLYYTDNIEEDMSEEIEEETSATPAEASATPNFLEQDLYEPIIHFLRENQEFCVYSKRINERKSSNTQGRKGNRWLHPDIVGIEPLCEGWRDDVKKMTPFEKKAHLWSFEVKRKVNRSNLREYFFQTVSNSGWANFGYLVAVIDTELIDELKLLSSLYGIGVIHFDPENEDESKILIPATRKSVHWGMAHRLAQVNPHFADYLEAIADFDNQGKVRDRFWDKGKSLADD